MASRSSIRHFRRLHSRMNHESRDWIHPKRCLVLVGMKNFPVGCLNWLARSARNFLEDLIATYGTKVFSFILCMIEACQLPHPSILGYPAVCTPGSSSCRLDSLNIELTPALIASHNDSSSIIGIAESAITSPSLDTAYNGHERCRLRSQLPMKQ